MSKYVFRRPEAEGFMYLMINIKILSEKQTFVQEGVRESRQISISLNVRLSGKVVVTGGGKCARM